MVDALIRAAGGVVHRVSRDRVEVAVVHRPRLDDWSLPKGKRRRGEHPIVNAHREVWEETGVRAVVGPRLPSVSYPVTMPDGTQTDKTVDYWAMSFAADDGFIPGDETDRMAWLPVDDALAQLTYERDVEVLKAFAQMPPLRDPVVLLRHASAGDQRDWDGPDDRRPLDAEGHARALVLEAVLSCFAPARLISAAPRRCVDTLVPLARRWDLPVTVDHAYDEGADPAAATAALVGFVAAPGTTVVCSQGKLIPPVLAGLTGGPAESYRTPKGRGWVLSFATNGLVVATDPLE